MIPHHTQEINTTTGQQAGKETVMVKYIDVLVNGSFAFRTVNHATLKSAVEETRRLNGCPLLGLVLRPGDEVTARFTRF